MDKRLSVLTGPPINLSFAVSQSIFVPGEPVSGELIVEVTSRSPVTPSNISVRLHGEEYCKWITFESSIPKTNRYPIIDLKEVVWQSEQGTQSFPPGISRVPFSIVLPYQCPPSWERLPNYIKYVLTATVNVKLGRGKSSSLLIPVGCNPQVLANTASCMSSEVRQTKSIGIPLLCYSAGGMEVSISTVGNVMPYMSHQTPLGLHLHAQNRSNKSVRCVVQLIEKTEFRGHSKPATFERVIGRFVVPDGRVAPYSTLDCNILLSQKWPPITTLLSIPGQIWNISYKARVSFKPSVALNFRVEFPILIGPLDLQMTHQGPVQQGVLVSSAPEVSMRSTIVPNDLPDYQETAKKIDQPMANDYDPGSKSQIVHNWHSGHPNQVAGAHPQTTFAPPTKNHDPMWATAPQVSQQHMPTQYDNNHLTVIKL